MDRPTPRNPWPLDVLATGAIVLCWLLPIAGCWERVHYGGADEPSPSAQVEETTEPTEPAATPAEAPPDEADLIAEESPESADESDESDDFPADMDASFDDDRLFADLDSVLDPEEDDQPADEPVDTPADEPERYAETPSEAAPPASDDAPVVDDLFGPLTDLEDDVAQADEPPAEPAESEPTLAAPPVVFDSPPEPVRPATPDDYNTRRAAWLLGSKLSLAALANDAGAPSAGTREWFGEAQRLARRLGAELTDLPPANTDDATDDAARRTVVEYLFPLGRQIGSRLASQHGRDHAALFELAFKSNVLLVLYEPGSSVADAIATAVEQAADRAGLPNHLWQPLIDQIASQADRPAVQQAVFRLHQEVDAHLIERTQTSLLR